MSISFLSPLLGFSFSFFLSYLQDLLRQLFCRFAFFLLADDFDHCVLYNVLHLRL